MRLLFSFAAAAAMLIAPLAASAMAPAGQTVKYHTAYHQTRPLASGGAITGTMRLTFSAGGIVNGTYRDDAQGGITDVAGGVGGDKVWLSFGNRGRRQFQGVIEKDGTISGTLTNWRGPNVFEFTAVPSTS